MAPWSKWAQHSSKTLCSRPRPHRQPPTTMMSSAKQHRVATSSLCSKNLPWSFHAWKVSPLSCPRSDPYQSGARRAAMDAVGSQHVSPDGNRRPGTLSAAPSYEICAEPDAEGYSCIMAGLDKHGSRRRGQRARGFASLHSVSSAGHFSTFGQVTAPAYPSSSVFCCWI